MNGADDFFFRQNFELFVAVQDGASQLQIAISLRRSVGPRQFDERFIIAIRILMTIRKYFKSQRIFMKFNEGFIIAILVIILIC